MVQPNMVRNAPKGLKYFQFSELQCDVLHVVSIGIFCIGFTIHKRSDIAHLSFLYDFSSISAKSVQKIATSLCSQSHFKKKNVLYIGRIPLYTALNKISLKHGTPIAQ